MSNSDAQSSDFGDQTARLDGNGLSAMRAKKPHTRAVQLEPLQATMASCVSTISKTYTFEIVSDDYHLRL
jgi:hypothetical protein